jgi:hypothetical protein
MSVQSYNKNVDIKIAKKVKDRYLTLATSIRSIVRFF